MPEAVGVWKPRHSLSEDEKVRTGTDAQTESIGMFKVPFDLFRRPWLSKATSTQDSLIKSGFRPMFIARNISMDHREPDWLKKFNKKLFSHENIESNSLDSTHQCNYWPQKVSNSVVRFFCFRQIYPGESKGFTRPSYFVWYIKKNVSRCSALTAAGISS